MRVFFYTGGFTHTFYREQAVAMPPWVTVIGSSGDLWSGGMKSDIAASSRAGYRAIRALKRTALATVVRLGVANVRYPRPPPCDLIHSAQYPLLNRQPWVVDFEDVSVFAWYDPANLAKPHVRGMLQRLFSRQSCRWLLPWTDAARQSTLNALDCRGFEQKIRVVYPAIRPAPLREKASDGIVRLLFVGTAFYYKGGLDVLLAFDRLRGRLPVQLTVVSLVPPEVRNRFESMQGLRLLSRVEPADLEAIFQSTDILVAPFHTDTFGFVMLEAFARGIPCVATDQFASREIVTDGVTGSIVENFVSRFGADRLPRQSMLGNGRQAILRELMDPPEAYVARLAGAIEDLVCNERRRLAMAAAARREVTDGRFSLQARRQAIAQVYST